MLNELGPRQEVHPEKRRRRHGAVGNSAEQRTVERPLRLSVFRNQQLQKLRCYGLQIPELKQKPWTAKHTGRGQTPVFKKWALHGAKTCDKWTRVPLRTVELTAKELEAVQVRLHDKDKTRYLVESPIISQSAGEREDVQESPALLGPILAEGDEIVFINDMPAGDLPTFRPVTNRTQCSL